MSFRRIFFSIILCLLLFLSFIYFSLPRDTVQRDTVTPTITTPTITPPLEVPSASPPSYEVAGVVKEAERGSIPTPSPTEVPITETPTNLPADAAHQALQAGRETETYIVLPGDTLDSIAKQYSVSWVDLANLNQISDPNYLSIGQQIIISHNPSGYQTADPYYISSIKSFSPALLASRSGSREGAGEGFKHILIVLSQQKLFTYEGETKTGEHLISSGTAEHPTVTGEYKIWIKLESTTMSGGSGADAYYLPNVPYTMYFYGDYGIHGTYWHNNFGTPMSHGCINMRTEDAKTVFNWADIGTIVQVVP